jgi:xanthine dehydrogenase accessory factor
MNKQLSVWNLVAESLKQNIPVMLLYVLESSGSSPGRQGFFMAVNANDEMEGSIGGGIMEHKFVEMAKEKLRALSFELRAISIKKQIHDKSVAKDQSGMICSGEQTILLYPVQKKDIKPIQNIISSLEENKNGSLQLTPKGIKFSEKTPGKDFYFSLRSENDWEYEERTGYKNKLFIIGGGHCALAFSRLMSQMDFYIHLYDDRQNLKTMQQNEYAHEKKVLADYSELTGIIPEGDNHYVVIMTFGYRTDDIAIKSLVKKEFKYVGLLGSKMKIEKMFNEYRHEGIDQKWLQRVCAPIGIGIKSQTPEEIAVSIAAEIIKLKNKNL